MMLNQEHLSKLRSALIAPALFVVRPMQVAISMIYEFFQPVNSFICSFHNPPCTEKKQNDLIENLEPEEESSKCSVEAKTASIILIVFCVISKRCI